MSFDGPVILFDGVCNLCNAAVRFVIRHDKAQRFRFAPLQSEPGRRLLERHGEASDLGSMRLLEQGRLYRKSDAALRIARRLDGPWPLLYAFVVVPRPLRDAVYDFVGRRRYRWFGKRETCVVPDERLRRRFLDGG